MAELEDIANVFIDASVIIGKNYEFDSALFSALVDRVRQGKCRLVTTDVVIKEVTCHILEDAKTAVTGMRKAKDSARVLRALPDHPLHVIFEDQDALVIADELTQRFHRFLDAVNAVVVPLEQADVAHVFDCYFQKRAPFGSGKKKSEFPDAFTLSGLDNWADRRGEMVCVVSQDKDMAEIAEHFPRLVPAQSLEEYLDRISFCYEDLAAVAHEALEAKVGEVIDAIERQFEKLDFVLWNRDGDVHGVEAAYVGTFDSYLIELETNSSATGVKALFGYRISIGYSATVCYDDFAAALRQTRGRSPIKWNTVTETAGDVEEVRGDVTLTFVAGKPIECEIERVTIQSPQNVRVRIGDDDDPYG